MSQLELVDKAVSKILESSAFDKAWELYRYSERKKHRTYDIAEKPLRLTFMREMVALLRKASGKPSMKDDADLVTHRQNLAAMAGALQVESSGMKIPNRRKLPKEYRDILDVIEKKTFQSKIRPTEFAIDTIDEVKPYAKKNPIKFSAATATAIGLVYFVNSRVSVTSNYISEESMRANNASFETMGDLQNDVPLSFDSVDNNFTYSDQPVDFDPSMFCHEEIAQLVGNPELAEAVKSIVESIPFIDLPTHCPRMQTLDSDALGLLTKAVDIQQIPFANAVAKPSVDSIHKISDLALEGTYFMNSMVETAPMAASAFYSADIIENIVVHTAIWAISHKATKAACSLNTDIYREMGSSLGDAWHRAVYARPLTSAFIAAAAGTSLYANNGFDVSIVMSVLAGAIFGHMADKLSTKYGENKNFVKEAMAGMPGDMSRFHDLASHAPLLEPVWKKRIMAGIALGALSAVGVVTADSQGLIDMIENDSIRELGIALSGHIGAGAAWALVGAFYVGFNIPQDMAIHTWFIALGVVTGLTSSSLGHGYKLAKVGINMGLEKVKNASQQVSQKLKSVFKTAAKTTGLTLGLTFSSSAMAPEFDVQEKALTSIEIHVPSSIQKPDMDLSALIKSNAFKLPSFPQDMVFS